MNYSYMHNIVHPTFNELIKGWTVSYWQRTGPCSDEDMQLQLPKERNDSKYEDCAHIGTWLHYFTIIW